MAHVKRQLARGRNGDFARQHTLRELAAVLIRQHVGDAADLVDDAGDSGISRANERSPRFHATEDCVREVLLRARGLFKPAVVCHVRQHGGAAEHEVSSELADSVLKADQRRDLNAAG